MDIQKTQKENVGKAIGATIPPKITHAFAMASVFKHYGVSPLIGGAIGYLLGSTTHVDQNRKMQVFNEILESQKNLNEFKEDGVQRGGETSKGIMNTSELLNYSYERYPFTGKWANFIGQPSKNFHAMIYGRPKQGKSILSVQFAQYLSMYGRVLYVASEEGFSVTLQNKIKEFAMDNPNLDFANFRTYEQIREALHVRKYSFVFIDSVNFIKITPEDIEDLKADNKNTAFITIQQATKNGNFRGSQEFAHNCDAVIRVEAGKAFHQGRFQEPSEMDVFDKPEEKKASSPMMSPSKESTQMDLFSAEDFKDEAGF